MPAPQENVNAVRHGMRSQRHGLVYARLGKRFSAAYADSCRLRREVERLLTQQHGALTLLQRARIQSLLRLESGIRACELMLRENGKMSCEEVRAQRNVIAQWTMQRDNLLTSLLGNGPASPSGSGLTESLYGSPDATHEPPAVDDTPEPLDQEPAP